MAQVNTARLQDCNTTSLCHARRHLQADKRYSQCRLYRGCIEFKLAIDWACESGNEGLLCGGRRKDGRRQDRKLLLCVLSKAKCNAGAAAGDREPDCQCASRRAACSAWCVRQVVQAPSRRHQSRRRAQQAALQQQAQLSVLQTRAGGKEGAGMTCKGGTGHGVHDLLLFVPDQAPPATRRPPAPHEQALPHAHLIGLLCR